jgi:hypothetical protein
MFLHSGKPLMTEARELYQQLNAIPHIGEKAGLR